MEFYRNEYPKPWEFQPFIRTRLFLSLKLTVTTIPMVACTARRSTSSTRASSDVSLPRAGVPSPGDPNWVRDNAEPEDVAGWINAVWGAGAGGLVKAGFFIDTASLPEQ
jgi:hypothetical protein